MKTHMLKMTVAVSLTLGAISAEAGSSIVGGSSLLDSGGLGQLESWLGEGDLTLTNIFTKNASSTSSDFHSAADGAGRTFTLLYATELNTGNSAIIGGYNPQSWNSSGNFNITYDVPDRNAFIFNLTSTTKHVQRQDLPIFDPGIYQTFNAAGFGPTFGYGYDIYVDGTLDQGGSYLFSYAYGPNFFTSVVDGSSYNGNDMQIGGMEVFSISPGIAVTPVPEPETYAMFMAGLGVMGIVARRKSKRVKTTN